MRFDQLLKEICPSLDMEWRKYRRRAARHAIERRMSELNLKDYAAYLQLLQIDPEEAAGLADRMRITVSRFFREKERWDLLARTVLPALLEEIGVQQPLRLWSVGCCGGEEPYTLALIWLEKLGARYSGRAVEILATDIDLPSLKRARNALYETGSMREVPKELRRRYFHRSGQHWQLVEEAAGLVSFARHNLMSDPLPQGMDLVCCRYLAFTYYRGRRRLLAARRLWQALRPGGALMIARKEDLGPASELFAPWPGVEGVFRKQPGNLAGSELDRRLGDDIGKGNCSGQLFPGSKLSFSSAIVGAMPSLL